MLNPRTLPRLMAILVTALIAIAALSSCASREQIADEYEPTEIAVPGQTTVFFLIDGLSVRTLKNGLASGRLPNIRRFFHTDRQFYQAHAAFPSLTFTNVSCLLTEQPVNENGFLGNKFFLDGHYYDFEKPLERKKYGTLVSHESNVFHRLSQRGETSISLDYGLSVDATVHAPLADLSTVIQIAEGEYAYADQKKIEILQLMLKKSRPSQWPAFVFIHLVGLDFISHSHGPDSPEAQAYLETLDELLEPLFEALRESESGTRQRIVSLLSADHGFNPITKNVVEIEKLIKPPVTILNESRMAALFWTKKNSPKPALLEHALQHSGVELLVERTADGYQVRSKTGRTQVSLRGDTDCARDHIAMKIDQGPWQCPSLLDVQSETKYYPFFLSNMAYYMSAANAPNAVLIPDRQTVFSEDYFGNHGGPTAEETLVPLLMRNATLNAERAPPIWRLLNLI